MNYSRNYEDRWIAKWLTQCTDRRTLLDIQQSTGYSTYQDPELRIDMNNLRLAKIISLKMIIKSELALQKGNKLIGFTLLSISELVKYKPGRVNALHMYKWLQAACFQEVPVIQHYTTKYGNAYATKRDSDQRRNTLQRSSVSQSEDDRSDDEETGG